MKISVIVTTYNWSAALERVLFGLNGQEGDFEVLIADDGSGSETGDVIREVGARLRYPWRHVWQEDCGFRAAKIRNVAAAEAVGDYFIFLDGDCVPTSSFIRRHRALAEAGWWVSGNRVLLSRCFTEKILAERLSLEKKSLGYWFSRRFSGDCNRVLPLLYLPFMVNRKLNRAAWKGAKTCNLAVWKKDFLKVNGFDESYEGWGYEDSDLVIRLIRSGVYRKSGRFALPVFHLWHPENDRASEPENLKRLETIRSSTHIQAAVGIDQYPH